MRKLLSFLIVLCLLLSLPGLSAFAEDALTWTLGEDGVLTISGEGEMHDFAGDVAPWRKYEAKIEELSVDYGVTHLGDQAFQYLKHLRAVYLPESVTSIGDAAFYGCTELRFVQLPGGLKEIGVSVFDHCAKLGSVTLPESVKRIGNAAFNCCSALEEIYIPASVTDIEDSAFNGCYKLKTVCFGGSESEWERIRIAAYNKPLARAELEFNADPADHIHSADAAFADKPGNVSWELSEDKKTLYVSCDNGVMPDYGRDLPPWAAHREKIRDIIVMPGVRHIGNQAFQYSKNALSVALPDSVTSIGDAAFYGCTSVLDVALPEGVREIGAQAFDGCTSLNGVMIREGVTVIREATFNRCSNLATVYIPASVKVIESSAFNGCNKLENIRYGGSAADWAAIEIGAYNRPLSRAALHTSDEIPGGIAGGVV